VLKNIKEMAKRAVAVPREGKSEKRKWAVLSLKDWGAVPIRRDLKI